MTASPVPTAVPRQGVGGGPAPATIVPPMPRQPVDPNEIYDFWAEMNEVARSEASDRELEPMSITEIADWFGKPAATVRRQWIYERDTIVDPQRRFPFATWPGQNPRWAWRIVKAWGIYTERLNEDGSVKDPKKPQ